MQLPSRASRSRAHLCLSLLGGFLSAQVTMAQEGAKGAAVVPPVAKTQHIAGRVVIGTGTLSRDRLQIYVQTQDRGWLVFNRARTATVDVGDSVDVSGIASNYRGMPELASAQVIIVPGGKRIVAPVPVSFRDAPLHLGELIQIKALVAGTLASERDLSLELIPDDVAARDTVGALTPRIRLFEYDDGTQPVDLRPFSVGDHVMATGVLARRDEIAGIPSYVLLPRVPSDVRSTQWTVGERRIATRFGLGALLIGGAIAGWILLLRRQIRRRTRALAASERRYARIFDESPAGNFVSTPDGRLLACNARFAALMGFASVDDACRAPAQSLYGDLSTRGAMIDRLVKDGRIVGLEIELRRADGNAIFVQENIVGQFNDEHELMELHGFLLDLTENRRLEMDLRQSQKMESIGRLAGGVAHDFNNLLTVILAASELALESVAPGHEVHEDLVDIRHAAERGVEVTRQLLAFSRRQLLKPAVVDVGVAIGNLTSLLRRLVGERVRISLTAPEAPCAVLVDSSVLEQALVNLAVNAADAMPDGGELDIEVAEVILDPAFVAAHEGAREGAHCRITVRDTGSGMDQETLLRAFEPFFTTKPVGKGTGLGLSMVFGFVNQSGGHVKIDSVPSGGTTVSLYLPRCETPVALLVPVQPERSGTSAELRAESRGTALVVEDEPQVRAIASRILRGLGFEVIEAADPAQALALSRTVTSLSVVLTDVVMPNGGGAEVARRIRGIFPGVPLVFMSGYTDDEVVLSGVKASTHDFIAKPFTPDALGSKILSVVGARPTERAVGHPESEAESSAPHRRPATLG